MDEIARDEANLHLIICANLDQNVDPTKQLLVFIFLYFVTNNLINISLTTTIILDINTNFSI